jgi:hypothetical protein
MGVEISGGFGRAVIPSAETVTSIAVGVVRFSSMPCTMGVDGVQPAKWNRIKAPRLADGKNLLLQEDGRGFLEKGFMSFNILNPL